MRPSSPNPWSIKDFPSPRRIVHRPTWNIGKQSAARMEQTEPRNYLVSGFRFMSGDQSKSMSWRYWTAVHVLVVLGIVGNHLLQRIGLGPGLRLEGCWLLGPTNKDQAGSSRL